MNAVKPPPEYAEVEWHWLYNLAHSSNLVLMQYSRAPSERGGYWNNLGTGEWLYEIDWRYHAAALPDAQAQIEKLTGLLRRIVDGSCEYDNWLTTDAWDAISEAKKEIGA